jgi:predicted DNA-binding transcriptional regulator YafY
MAKRGSDGAIERQWQLLKLLPSEGSGITASQLAERYASNAGLVSDEGKSSLLRKIQRDLETLLTLDLVECNDKGKPFGWKQQRKTFFANMTATEALFLNLAETAIKPLIPTSLLTPLLPAFAKARELLSDSSNKSTARLNRRITSMSSSPLSSPDINGEFLEVIFQAIQQQKILAIDYLRPMSTATKSYQLNPLGIFQHAPSIYLYAINEGYDNGIFFALHRIKSARLTTLSSSKPAIDIHALKQAGSLRFGNKGAITLVLDTTEQAARRLAETPLAADQCIQPLSTAPHTHRITATVDDSWDLFFWLMSQGSNIAVVEPQALRARIHAEIQAALARYQTV